MARPDYFLCDICGEKAGKGNHVPVMTGYSLCPAGGRAEQNFEYVDLCDKHLASSVVYLLHDEKDQWDEILGKRLLDWVKGKRKTIKEGE